MEISREVTLDASADEVWRLLTNEDELATWLADEATLDVRPGGAGRFVEGGEVRWAHVDEIETGQRLRLLWWSQSDTEVPVSEVTFTLSPAESEGRTRLRVVERVRGGVGPKGRALDVAAWDHRLLGLEMRCLAGASLAHC